MESIKDILLLFSCLIIFILYIAIENFRITLNDILNKKIFLKKISLNNILVIVFLSIIIICSFFILMDAKENVIYYINFLLNPKNEISESDLIIEKQNKRYKELISQNIDIDLCKSPYIPNEFEYIEGEWNTGFVIEDENNNQFVWIPCTNSKNEENIPILKKELFDSNNISYFYCYELDDYEDFIMSCLNNGGFYISRFEIGKENDKPVSKKGVKIWNNINWNDAYQISKNMYNNINSRLINGYAIDTAMSFINDEVDKENIEKYAGISGNKSYKNIYDLVDDMFEWTSEMRNNNKIFRGSIFENRVSKNLLNYNERISNDETYLSENLGFRTIIYK